MEVRAPKTPNSPGIVTNEYKEAASFMPLLSDQQYQPSIPKSSTSNLSTATSCITSRPLTSATPHPPSSIELTQHVGEDQKVKFRRALRKEKMAPPKPISWTAHRLTVECVQPRISENQPPPQKMWCFETTHQPSTSALTTEYTVKGQNQVCRSRLTSSLLPPAPRSTPRGR